MANERFSSDAVLEYSRNPLTCEVPATLPHAQNLQLERIGYVLSRRPVSRLMGTGDHLIEESGGRPRGPLWFVGRSGSPRVSGGNGFDNWGSLGKPSQKSSFKLCAHLKNHVYVS
jgi:hypothetical protein